MVATVVERAKILVIYDSRTGNTERMSSAVADGAKQIDEAEVAPQKVDVANFRDLLNVDAVIIGVILLLSV